MTKEIKTASGSQRVRCGESVVKTNCWQSKTTNASGNYSWWVDVYHLGATDRLLVGPFETEADAKKAEVEIMP